MWQVEAVIYENLKRDGLFLQKRKKILPLIQWPLTWACVSKFLWIRMNGNCFVIAIIIIQCIYTFKLFCFVMKIISVNLMSLQKRARIKKVRHKVLERFLIQRPQIFLYEMNSCCCYDCLNYTSKLILINVNEERRINL